MYVCYINLNPGQNYFRKLNFYFKNIFATYLNEAIGTSSYPKAYGRISKNLAGHFTKLESSLIFPLPKKEGRCVNAFTEMVCYRRTQLLSPGSIFAFRLKTLALIKILLNVIPVQLKLLRGSRQFHLEIELLSQSESRNFFMHIIILVESHGFIIIYHYVHK